jgi:hypothetical protein
VPVVPVEVSVYWVVRIEKGGVGDVADKTVDPGFVLERPVGIEMADEGGSVDEVAVVEVVIVVICVSEVSTCITAVRGRGDETIPDSVVNKRELLVVGGELCESLFESS